MCIRGKTNRFGYDLITFCRFPSFASPNHAVDDLGEAVVALEADRPSEPPAS